MLDGRVVGIHLQTVNQAIQLSERLHAMKGLQGEGAPPQENSLSIPELTAQVNEIQDSLSSVIQCLASGGIAIACSAFLDPIRATT